MKTILITAFEPFGGSSVNTSAEVLERLPESIAGCRVIRALLPVVFGKAAEKALQTQAQYVFLLGEAGGRETVTPEIRARNLRSARIPDNEGNSPQAQAILPGGPDEYRTRIPVDSIVRQMLEEGFSVAVSEDAGTFVCNDTYYLVGMNSRVPVTFVHVPADPDHADVYAAAVKRFVEIAAGRDRDDKTGYASGNGG